jgi:hypothetical protein
VAFVPVKEPVTTLISPNPASGTLYLSLPVDKQYTVDVYSVAGVKTLSQRVKGNRPTVNVAALHDGLYIVTITDGKRVISKEKVLINNK